MPRTPSIAGRLARLGFIDIERAVRVCESVDLSDIIDSDHIWSALGGAADPDLALTGLDRLVESARESNVRDELVSSLLNDAEFRTRLIQVLGASEALAEHLVRHPAHFWVLCEADGVEQFAAAESLVEDLTRATLDALEQRGSWTDAACALRVAYRKHLLVLAARDLTGAANFNTVTRRLADLADAVLAAALELARTQLPADAAPCRLAIIAMGKCGGRELNYVSDVDVIFVAEPGELPDGSLADETAALSTATTLARGVMRAANEPTPEGVIWEVDPALRPEGKSGALVRTLASHVGYYQRWAQTWEFQALLKARFAAGDARLGHDYVDAIMPFVWSAADRPNFVKDVQEMRRRVESHLPVSQADREIKLGKGGLRDVEFSVQLLQLVHGRSDVMVRSSNTLDALDSMALWGYVGREDASTLASAYRFLRTMEHRLQLYRMQRTHLVPDDGLAVRRLGRAMGFPVDSAAQLTATWSKKRLAVRRLHEKLFYRPLLDAVARLDSGTARLSVDAARERLTALGYADPQGALRHIEALTSGVSRRAAIQRTLLPVLLEWFADGPNPDNGLAAFRQVSDSLGTTPWYLRLLRDESETAERLAHVLSASRFATDLLKRSPEAVALLSDVADLAPRQFLDVLHEMSYAAKRRDTADAAALAVRTVRARELFRVASADINGVLDPVEVGHALSDLADATVAVTLEIAMNEIAQRQAVGLPIRFAVIAMGRLGGREVGYGSDIDAMFVYEPIDGADEHQAARAAVAVANELKRLLSLPSADPSIEIDADLRPEGRSGALARTLASYRAYYSRWSSPWEAQALLRARPLAGDLALGQQFMDMIDPLRYPCDGVDETSVVEARRLKARMESERLPKGADPTLNVKLGRGGLSDVEWTAQLLQLRHAGESSFGLLRTTDTISALTAAVSYGLLDPRDDTYLRQAWEFATDIRNAIYLVTGRASDQIPSDFATLGSIAYIVGYPVDRRAELVEDYLRLARHSREVMERLFYGWDDPTPPA